MFIIIHINFTCHNVSSKIPPSEKSQVMKKLLKRGICCSGIAVCHDNISMNLIKDSSDKIIFPITSKLFLYLRSGEQDI